MAFLSLDRLTKTYDATYAVRDLSLEVARGELVALLGPSGCGKSTTLQMIAGFVPPTSGTIRLDGRDLADVKPSQRGLGIVFQSYALFPHMTAAENVAFGLEMRGITRADRDRRVVQALEMVGLGPLADRYPRRMSGGQQQRVALARALVIEPAILLLDEPLSNLDAKLREEMQIELRQIQRTLGTTTILVTHDQGEAMALADRLVVMNKGAVEQIGAPHETYEWPATAFVAEFLGRTNVLEGVASDDGRSITISGATWGANGVPKGPVQVSVRPEKIGFLSTGDTAPGLDAVVKARIFQGNHWLYQVTAGDRVLTVIQQNAGGPVPGEGDPVRIGWQSDDMRVRAGPGGRP